MIISIQAGSIRREHQNYFYFYFVCVKCQMENEGAFTLADENHGLVLR